MRARTFIATAAVVLAAASALAACSGPTDLTVVNPCTAAVTVQTYDGHREHRRWVPDAEPVAEFVVAAGTTHTERDALIFATVPEEIRLVAPVEASYLVSIVDDLDDDNTWTIPASYCDRIRT